MASSSTPAASAPAELLKSWQCFGGVVRRYKHSSAAVRTPMNFVVFLPPAALVDQHARVPAIFFLSG